MSNFMKSELRPEFLSIHSLNPFIDTNSSSRSHIPTDEEAQAKIDSFMEAVDSQYLSEFGYRSFYREESFYRYGKRVR